VTVGVRACWETFENRGADANQKGERTYTRTFAVVMTGRDDDPNKVRLPLPAPGDVYVGSDGTVDARSYVQSVRLRQNAEDPWLWQAEVSYGPQSTDAAQATNDPLAQPAQVSFSSKLVNVVMTKDADGKTVENSAGDPFDPPLEMEEVRIVVKVRKNLASFDPSQIARFAGAVNEEEFLGAAQGTLKCTAVSGDPKTERGQTYYEAQVEFEFKATGWESEVLDAGFRELDEIDQWVNVIDKRTGTFAAKPVPLDGEGHELAADAEPVFLKFQPHQSIDFNQMGIL
jgi:hypothetical protein